MGIDEDEVFVGSTGVIGRLLEMPPIEDGIASIELSPEGGPRFARAILTTDTRAKEAAVSFAVDGVTYHVGGCAKGSGMVHPDMATMFGFITTDAPVDRVWLQAALGLIANRTFNMLDIDMDTSTSDTVLILAQRRGRRRTDRTRASGRRPARRAPSKPSRGTSPASSRATARVRTR